MTHSAYRRFVGVDMHGVNGGVVDKVKCAHIIYAARMVLMFVREEYSIDMPYPFAEHLVAEIGPCIYDYALRANLHHC